MSLLVAALCFLASNLITATADDYVNNPRTREWITTNQSRFDSYGEQERIKRLRTQDWMLKHQPYFEEHFRNARVKQLQIEKFLSRYTRPNANSHARKHWAKKSANALQNQQSFVAEKAALRQKHLMNLDENAHENPLNEEQIIINDEMEKFLMEIHLTSSEEIPKGWAQVQRKWWCF